MRTARSPILSRSLVLAAAAAVTITAGPADPLSGRWRNAKGSVTVIIKPCGRGWCGVVVDATAKAKQSARQGGTPVLVGTEVLSGVHRAGANDYKGRVFDPKRKIHASATLRLISPRSLEVSGCVFAGIICKEQQWTRLDD